MCNNVIFNCYFNRYILYISSFCAADLPNTIIRFISGNPCSIKLSVDPEADQSAQRIELAFVMLLLQIGEVGICIVRMHRVLI